MKHRMKVLGVALLVFVGLLGISFIHHLFQLNREADLLKEPMGKLVDVNGHQMNVYSQGKGSKKIVFLSGSGTTSPVLDFKTLGDRLSQDFQIVVIEKSGYGYSEVSDSPRDIDTLLKENRLALHKAGIEGPYILAPHSMSGIEAVYWSQQYPEEVEGIIGLDMVVPAFHPYYKVNPVMIHLASAAARIGIPRWIPEIEISQAVKYGQLTDEEAEISAVLFYHKTLVRPMLEEIKSFVDNAKIVEGQGAIHTTLLMFTSNGSDLGLDKDAWLKSHEEFVDANPKSQWYQLDAPHYLHNHKDDFIADKIRAVFK